VSDLVGVWRLLARIIEAAQDIRDGCGLEPVCRASVVPAGLVAWDACERTSDGRDGQLWAAVQTLIPANPTGGAAGCWRGIWQAELGVVRCVSTVDDQGRPPPAAWLAEDAWTQARDADALARLVLCCQDRWDPQQQTSGVELVGWDPLGPDGGCVGGRWIIRGEYDECCA